MGFMKPKTPRIEQTPIYAQQKTPDYAGGTASAGRRTTDRERAAQNTVLTSSTGVGTLAPTASTELTGNNGGKKTVLGQ